MFHRIDNTFEKGSHLLTYFEIEPRLMVEVFGPPGEEDEWSKSSGSCTFEDDTGKIFRVYEYEATTKCWNPECHPDADVLTPEQFWAADLPYDFHIGGTEVPAEFIVWLEKKLDHQD